MVAALEPREYLKGWYPGFGERVALERLPDRMQQFLSDAIQEYPEFLDEYVIPALQSPDPYDHIFEDMTIGLAALDMAESGLGEYETNLDHLGGLGKSFWKRVGSALKKSLNPIQAIKGVAKFTAREVKKEVKLTEKIFRKYGAIILTVAGAVLSPFTGGASAAAAAILIAAQKAYQVHAAAAKARKEARAEANQLQQQADAQNAQVEQQVDQFYAQNAQWFQTQLGVDQAKWNQLTLQEKIDLINSGTTGQLPPNATPTTAPSGTTATTSPIQNLPTQNVITATSTPPPDTTGIGPTVTTPSIYGGGGPPAGGVPSGPSGGPPMPPMPTDATGGGGDWGNISVGPSGASYAPPGQAPTPTVIQASSGMSDMLLPAAVVAAALIFSSGRGGGSRSRRNPSRRRRRR